MTENEMVRWHHQLDGRELEQAPGVGDAHNTQGSLVCYILWGQKVSDMTEQLKNNNNGTKPNSPRVSFLNQMTLS